MSKAVEVLELRTRLGSYLREVRRGRTIVVTDRGEPVAELRPTAAAKAGAGAEPDRLVALGRLTRASKAPLAPIRPSAVLGTTAITDEDWYSFLEQRPDLTELNFWTPSAHRSFRAPDFSPLRLPRFGGR